MFLFRIIAMALGGLWTNLFRSLLATLGVIIGVGAVIAAVSILQGAEREILERFESLGADQLIVLNGSSRRQGRSVTISSLKLSDADAIERDNPTLVAATAPQVQAGSQVKYYQRNVYAPVLGTSPAYASINSYDVADGRFLTREDVRGNAMVCILGHKVAGDLFGVRSAVGMKVKIAGKSFDVVGVMVERGTLGFIEVDKQVIIPITTAMGRMYGRRKLTSLIVQSTDPTKLVECIESVKKTLRSEHRIRAGKPDDFIIFTQEQIKENFAQVAVIFAVVLYSIAGISMVVGGIGIMNIMMVAVTERTREIGVRMAVGARRSDILIQFLFEAGIISLFGGGLGVLWGLAVSNLLDTVVDILTTYTPPIAIVFALVMAMVVGLLSGVYPAMKAARLDPVQALRFE